MTTNTVCYSLITGREKSNPTHHPRAARAVASRAIFDQVVGGDNLTAAAIDIGLVRPSAWYEPEVCPYRRFGGNAAGTAPEYLEWEFGQPAGLINNLVRRDGVPTPTAALGESMFFTLSSEGRAAPRPQFGIADTNSVTQCVGTLYWSNELNYVSDMNIMLFEEFPPGTPTQGGGAPPALLRALQNNPSSTVMAGTTVVQWCSATGIAPEGRIWIDPGDIGGIGPNAIPGNVTDNTAEQFLAHPSVFIPSGSSKYIRSVNRIAADDIEITAAFVKNPIVITSISTPVSESYWLVGVDGAQYIIRLQHPAGTDYRRPKDIWNNMIAPALIQGAQIGSLLGFSEQAALAAESSLKYSHYWRFLASNGTEGDLTQDDSVSPG